MPDPNTQQFPKAKVEAYGDILYRCADCQELMKPEDAVIVNDKSWHVEHAPQENNGR